MSHSPGGVIHLDDSDADVEEVVGSDVEEVVTNDALYFVMDWSVNLI
jgi:hypothetical protein